MPSAAPVPRGPSILLLGSAAGLLDRPGCPACRYVAESSEAYLSWFALDGHHDIDVLTTLCASRGMCAPHTRRLMSQPGAAVRLTMVYRYVLDEARRDLCARRAPCPACTHDLAATDRVLDLLLDDLAAGDRRAYERHGGLCLPHLRRAARRCRSLDVRWLVRVALSRLSGGSPSLGLVAGMADYDAAARAALRASLDRVLASSAPSCWVCWGAAEAERGHLGSTPLPAGRLCPEHLRDVALAVSNPDGVLAWQAEREVACLTQVLEARPRRRARRVLGDPDCPVCSSRDQAAADELERLRSVLAAPAPAARLAICARHVSELHALDGRAGRAAARRMAAEADRIVEELVEAFAAPQPHLHNGLAPEPAIWRRAAGFLDGAVFGGAGFGALGSAPGPR